MTKPTAGGWRKTSRHSAAANHDTSSLHAAVTTALAGVSWTQPDWPAKARDRIIADGLAPNLPAAFAAATSRSIDEIMRIELAALAIPSATSSSAAAQVSLRERLRSLLDLTTDHAHHASAWSATLTRVLSLISAAVPPLAHTQASFTVPIIELIANPAGLVGDIVACLLKHATEPGHHGLGAVLAERIKTNLLRVSGLSEEAARTNPLRIKAPGQSGLSGRDLLRAYLGGTPFEHIFNTQIPFGIPRKKFASHGIILAPPNFGKSQLLGAIVHGFLQEPDPPGLFVLDPHGDLIDKLQKLDVFHPEHGRLRDRLLILDPDTDPPDFNFLDLRTASEGDARKAFSYLMSALSGGLSDKQGAVSLYLLKLLQKIPNASIETLRLIIDEKVKSPDKSHFATAIRALDKTDQGFFDNQFYATRMQETKDAIGWKLYNALASSAFRKMFSAPRSSFNAHDAIEHKQVVLVKGGRRSLDDDGMSVFLQFIVAQFFVAALARERLPEDQRDLCILVADEAHHLFNSQTTNILTECRKYGLGWLGATQVIEQIPADVKAAIYGATAIKIAGPVAHSDSVTLGREMYCSPEFIRSMDAVERSHGEFAVYVAGVTGKQAIRLIVPYGSLENAPQMNAAAHARMRDANRIRISAPVAAPPPPTPEPEPRITPKKW